MKSRLLNSFLFGTIRGRLILSVALVHAVLMTLFVFDLINRQRAFLLEREVAEATAIAQSMAVSGAVWIASDDLAGLQEIVESQLRYPELSFAILTDAGGRILAHIDHDRVGQYLLDLPDEALESVITKAPSLVDVLVPALLGDRQVGWARVGIGQGATNKEFSDILVLGFNYAGGATLIGSLVAWFLGRRITRRLYVVQKTISKVRSGDHGARSVLSGGDEAASIATEFNTLLDTLDTRNSSLVRSESKYRLLIQNIGAAVVVHGADARILVCNPMAERLLGLSLEQMTGETADPVWHFLREDGTVLPVEAYPVNRTLTSGKALHNLTLGVSHPDRSEVTWVLAATDPTRDENGHIVEVIVTFVDITRRRLVEAALQESEQRYRDIFDNVLDGLCLFEVTDEGRFRTIEINPALERLTGIPRAQSLGKTLEEIVPEPFAGTLNERFRRCVEVGHPTEEEVEWDFPSGKKVFLLTLVPSRDQGGRIYRLIGISRDVTDRKHAELMIRAWNEDLEKRVAERTVDLNSKTSELESVNAKLQDLDRLKSMFIASMSHELRTPLNSIIGFSTILLNEWTGPLTSEQKENLTAVLRSGRHLLSLINDVIDVSKIEAGKIESIPEDFEVGAMVAEAVEPFQKEVRKKGLTLQVRAPQLVLHNDRRRLLQCLLNLVSNAVKYTNRGSILVSAEPGAGPSLSLVVEDTGLGIKDEDRSRLFTPFLRFNEPGASTIPGTGLGLYLTMKLVREIFQGTIEVQSTHGRGSRFTIWIPSVGEGGRHEDSARD